MPISGKKVIKILKKNGWVVVSQKRSHVKLKKEGNLVIIPIHSSKDIGIGLLRAIEKQTGEKLR